MLCLGIETSCDETALALIQDGRIRAESLASQERLHALFGGVVPELASREHLRVIGPMLDRIWEQSGLDMHQVQGIAVARGPGLLGSLLVGMGLAKGLAMSLDVPLCGVNHLQAHLLAPGLEQDLCYPALGLVISGGHTQIGLLRSPFDLNWLGRTLDDAVGEAFDKTARMLNLPYPGGRIIDELSGFAHPDPALFTRPYVANQNLDFSFSGLKTAVGSYIQAHPELIAPHMQVEPDVSALAASHPALAGLCASLNWCIAATLSLKLRRAVRRYPQVRSIVVAGGVAANSHIRSAMAQVARECALELRMPRPGLCTDNGPMIAYTGELYLQAGYAHSLDIDAVPRGKPLPEDWIRIP